MRLSSAEAQISAAEARAEKLQRALTSCEHEVDKAAQAVEAMQVKRRNENEPEFNAATDDITTNMMSMNMMNIT